MARKTVQLALSAAAIVVVLAAGSASAATPNPPAKQPGGGGAAVAIPLRAQLSATNVSSLQVASTASGRFLGAIIRGGFGAKGERVHVAWGFFWTITAQNTTGPITSVEIRTGEVSATAGPVFLSLCSPCNAVNAAAAAGLPGMTILAGTISNLTVEQVNTLRRGGLIVNASTAANPAGELRGQITRITPASIIPPNHRIPNPLKPGPPNTIPTITDIPG